MIDHTIAHYRITSKLGQGGMGEVYRAMDNKLDREVAIKILPESFAGDRDRIARFNREAKVLAALNHPNIAAIYGIEQSNDVHALVMELVEGETLGQRLKRQPMTVTEALDCCRQIAEALEAAHEKGIIHRDLKPENVKVDQDGRVKVLDFGLAKEVTGPASSVNQANSPTLTNLGTLPGQLLGTAPYMSPEQARAKSVDKRSDIWSFGCVLYECLTAKAMFHGEDVTETLATIIKGEPDWSALPQDTPPTIELLLRKCLAKDRKRRLRDIGDARIDIEQALGDPSSSIIRLSDRALQQALARTGLRWKWVLAIVACAAILTAHLTWFVKPVPMPEPPLPKSSEIMPNGVAPSGSAGTIHAFAISHDGTSLVYDLGEPNDGYRLRDLVTGEDRAISGTEVTPRAHPFLSWDGSRLGFVLANELVTIPTAGGTLRSLEIPGINFLMFEGADWNKAGDIVFTTYCQPLRLISKDGGEPRAITDLTGDIDHLFPQFLPDGDHVLFLTQHSEGGATVRRAAVVSVTTGDRKDLDVGDCRFVRYCASGHSSGHLLYSAGSDVFAKAFDLKRMAVSGPVKKVLSGVRSRDGRAQFNVAVDGTLVYVHGEAQADPARTLLWIDTHGETEPFTPRHDNWNSFDLSHNEKRVALEKEGDIWVLDIKGEGYDELRPLVTHDATDSSPLWSPDNESVYFYSNRGGKNAVWKKKADYAGAPAELVCESPSGLLWPVAVSSNTLVMVGSSGGFDIWRLNLNDDQAQPQPWMNEAYAEVWPVISPDGKWIAYFKDEENTPACYLRRMDGSGGTQLVSNGEGFRPQWSPNGDRIFYHRGSTIFSRSFSEQGDRLTPEKPKEVVTIPQLPYGMASNWRVSRDGQRFLMLVEAAKEDSNAQTSTEPTHLKMITHWFTELNQKVPRAGEK